MTCDGWRSMMGNTISVKKDVCAIFSSYLPEGVDIVHQLHNANAECVMIEHDSTLKQFATFDIMVHVMVEAFKSGAIEINNVYHDITSLSKEIVLNG